LQEVVVFKFKVLDEKMKLDAMEVIWEFSGTPKQTYSIINYGWLFCYT